MTKPAPKKWKAEEILLKLETNNAWLYKGLMAIYKLQTDDEKSSEITKHENSVGFNGPDSNIMTRLAKQYEKHGMLYAQDLKICRDRMKKYAGQLAKIANGLI